jgi:hypothetical protein
MILGLLRVTHGRKQCLCSSDEEVDAPALMMDANGRHSYAVANQDIWVAERIEQVLRLRDDGYGLSGFIMKWMDGICDNSLMR